ncbi:hypothetical protein ACEPAG_2128 [Sanghuangporus baumii]
MKFSVIAAIAILQLSWRVSCSEGLRFSSRTGSHIVDVGDATLRPYSVAFLGISYAETPIGDLRSRAPVLLEWTPRGLEKTKRGGDAGGAGSKDCLKIHTTDTSRLPVLFYMHRGEVVHFLQRSAPRLT